MTLIMAPAQAPKSDTPLTAGPCRGAFKALRLMPPTPTWEASVCDDGDTRGKIIADSSLDLQNEASFNTMDPRSKDQIISHAPRDRRPATEGRQTKVRLRRQNND